MRTTSDTSATSQAGHGAGGRRAGAGTRLANWVLVIVSVALALAVAEGAIRMLQPKSDTRRFSAPIPGSGRIGGLLPNREAIRSGVVIQTNATGQRGPDITIPKPAGVFRIIGLGDSFTFGTGVPFEDTYLQVLERELNARGIEAGRRVETVNFGTEGYNTEQELAYLTEVGAGFQPDLVLVGYLYNDIDPKSNANEAALADNLPSNGEGAAEKPSVRSSDSSARSVSSRITNAMFRVKGKSQLLVFLSPRVGALARKMGLLKSVGYVGAYRAGFAEESPGWIRSREALLEIDRVSRSIGARTAVVVFPAFVSLDRKTYPLTSYHEAVTEFCRTNGIPVLDLFPEFQGKAATRYWVSVTDPHPNSRANRIIGSAIGRFLVDGGLIASTKETSAPQAR
ncbi:MAG: SGNH/GDSL hydrolase family protein [Candidatus Eisenbacteria bacterium]